MATDEETLARMKADMLTAARIGLFSDVSGVVLATVKLEFLKRKGEDRQRYGELAQQMFAGVCEELAKAAPK
jgi:hypothetical protein